MIIDELNNLITEYLSTQTQFPQNREETIDTLLDILIMAYVFGTRDVNKSLGTNIEPNTNNLNSSVYHKIDGENWEDRVREAETFDDLERIVFTESHRDFSEGQYDTAVIGGATHKTWVTMQDDRVRDSHWYLDGVKVGIDDYFYTLDGDYARHPFDFLEASNNINCRCFLEYTKE